MGAALSTYATVAVVLVASLALKRTFIDLNIPRTMLINII